MPLVSIIVPAYNEASNLAAVYGRLRDVTAGAWDFEFEFLFVDDGSTDETPGVLARLREPDSRVKAIRFSRNFGSHAACLSGLSEAKGDYIGFLAADLQDPPELIPRMLAKIREGFDVVFAVRSRRADSFLTVGAANLYHRLMRRYAIPTWPEQGADVFLITRAVRDVIINWRQKNTSVFAQILWVGFRQASISYTKEERHSGRSKWTLAKKVKLLVDSLVSFSFTPIRVISYAGIGLAALGFLYAALILGQKLFNGTRVPGWTIVLIAFLMVSGFQLLTLGVIGEYLWRVADEVRGAPPFVVESRMGIDSASSTDQHNSKAEGDASSVEEFRIINKREQRAL